jgi:hypothetical protein
MTQAAQEQGPITSEYTGVFTGLQEHNQVRANEHCSSPKTGVQHLMMAI